VKRSAAFLVFLAALVVVSATAPGSGSARIRGQCEGVTTPQHKSERVGHILKDSDTTTCFLSHRGRVPGIPDSRVRIQVATHGSRPIKTVGAVGIRLLPAECVNNDTGEERTSSLEYTYVMHNIPIIHKRFHLNEHIGHGNVDWHWPRGGDLPKRSLVTVSGHFERRGKRAFGTFIAKATVHGEWTCTTGRVRWRTQAFKAQPRP
jgi:hypothetical protein